jgi:hypothetical protein
MPGRGRDWERTSGAYCREGIIGARPTKEIPCHHHSQARRGRRTHRVFQGPRRSHRDHHQAHSRENFARGSLRAPSGWRAGGRGAVLHAGHVLIPFGPPVWGGAGRMEPTGIARVGLFFARAGGMETGRDGLSFRGWEVKAGNGGPGSAGRAGRKMEAGRVRHGADRAVWETEEAGTGQPPGGTERRRAGRGEWRPGEERFCGALHPGARSMLRAVCAACPPHRRRSAR